MIAVDDLIKQSHLTTAPSIDRLLTVSYDEYRTLFIARCLVDEGEQAQPIGVAGVLKLIKQPMFVARIESEVHSLAPQSRIFAFDPLAHQEFHVVEAE